MRGREKCSQHAQRIVGIRPTFKECVEYYYTHNNWPREDTPITLRAALASLHNDGGNMHMVYGHPVSEHDFTVFSVYANMIPFMEVMGKRCAPQEGYTVWYTLTISAGDDYAHGEYSIVSIDGKFYLIFNEQWYTISEQYYGALYFMCRP